MGLVRLFLAYIVLLSHAPQGILLSKLLHPALAVQCFYAISGFYMQLLINQYQKNASGTPWVRDFYKSRVIRLFPVYYICLLLTVIIDPHRLHVFLEAGLGFKLGYLINNLFLFPQDFFRFFPLPCTIMGQSWTLSLEMMFYLVAPFLLVRRTRLLVLVVMLSICIRLTLRDDGLYLQQWFYCFFPSEIAIFLAGSLAYRFYDRFLAHLEQKKQGLAKLVGFLVFCHLFHVYLRGWHTIPGGEWDGQATCGAPLKYWYVLFMTIVSLPFIFKWSKLIKIDRFIGELSYPVYLSHILFIDLLIRYQVNTGYVNVFALVLTLAFSLLLTRYIEIPLSRYRHSLREEKREPFSPVSPMPAIQQA